MPLRPLNDVVYTNPDFAKRIITYFEPTGTILDPCRGRGAFYNSFPIHCNNDWCEIAEGKDFLTYEGTADWIITNPPWSSNAYKAFCNKSVQVANNIVFLVRLHNAIGTVARNNIFRNAGFNLQEIIHCKWQDAGIKQEGFSLGVFHWKKTENNMCKISYW